MELAVPDRQSNGSLAQRPDDDLWYQMTNGLSRALARAKLTGNQHRIAHAILYHDRPRRKGAPPEPKAIGNKVFVEATGLRAATVIRELRALEKAGIVTVERTPGEGKGHRSNRYSIAPPNQWDVRFLAVTTPLRRERRRPLEAERSTPLKVERTVQPPSYYSPRESEENEESDDARRDVGIDQQQVGAPKVAPDGTKRQCRKLNREKTARSGVLPDDGASREGEAPNHPQIDELIAACRRGEVSPVAAAYQVTAGRWKIAPTLDQAQKAWHEIETIADLAEKPPELASVA